MQSKLNVFTTDYNYQRDPKGIFNLITSHHQLQLSTLLKLGFMKIFYNTCSVNREEIIALQNA